ncbi:MAG TPA: hypothetical protein VMX55_06320 [candidate division Zixibacteria bacterium]|nr:hypothetical protein [candidate division Zixibacteria bacterium]
MVLEILSYITVGLITIGWIIAITREFIPSILKIKQKFSSKTKENIEEEI